MSWRADQDPDYDAGWEGSPGIGHRLDGGLPKLPKIGLPSFGFPLLPSFDFDFGRLFSVPSFVKDLAESARLDALAAAVNELGIEVDLDYDMDASTLIAEARKAAGDKASALASRIAAAKKIDFSKAVDVPKLPKIGLPSFGFPALPSFDFDFGTLFSPPGFVADLAEGATLDALASLATRLGLGVDLDYDLDPAELARAIEEAAGEQAASAASGIAKARSLDFSELVKPPSIPVPGLPSFGFPLLPSFDFDVGLGAGDPLARLASWLED